MIRLRTLELMLLLAESLDLDWHSQIALNNQIRSLIEKHKELMEKSKEEWPPY